MKRRKGGVRSPNTFAHWEFWGTSSTGQLGYEGERDGARSTSDADSSGHVAPAVPGAASWAGATIIYLFLYW